MKEVNDALEQKNKNLEQKIIEQTIEIAKLFSNGKEQENRILSLEKLINNKQNEEKEVFDLKIDLDRFRKENETMKSWYENKLIKNKETNEDLKQQITSLYIELDKKIKESTINSNNLEKANQLIEKLKKEQDQKKVQLKNLFYILYILI